MTTADQDLPTSDRDRFWNALSGSAFLRVLVAIFLTFTVVGFIQDIMAGGTTPSPRLAMSVVGAGLTALAWFITVVRFRGWLPFLIVLQIGLMLATRRFLPPLPAVATLDPIAIQHRLTLDGLGCLIGVIGGYGFFISVIATEGVRHFRLGTEVALAHEIHEVLVPALDGRHAGIEYYGNSTPSSEMGGDLIDLVGPPGSLVAYIADVSGHGVPAGLLMGMTKSAARMKLAAGAEISTFLAALNNIIADVKKPDMFVTCGCLRLSTEGHLEYASAGHLPLMHYRRATGKVEEWLSPGFPLGLVRGSTYETVTRVCATGDLLIFVTDGLTEVFDGRDEEFGSEGIAAVVEQHPDAPLAEIAAAIRAAVARHGTALDDQTLLLVRRMG